MEKLEQQARWLLSRLAGWIAHCRWAVVAQPLIRLYIRVHHISLDETVANSPSDFACLNDFFVRPLRPGTRTMPSSKLVLASPCDGCISHLGRIEDGQVIQAKNLAYPVAELVGEQASWRSFEGGDFVTFYLSPKDYHRVHAPCELAIVSSHYHPGRRLSVRPGVVANTARLFSRNERLVLTCDAAFGRMVLVMVGAFLVSGIRTTWRTVCYGRAAEENAEYFSSGLQMAAGAEIGRFEFGSAVIVLLPPAAAQLDSGLQPQSAVRVGEPFGQIKAEHSPQPPPGSRQQAAT